jgi:hypothetical protein
MMLAQEGISLCAELKIIVKTPLCILFHGGSLANGERLKEVDIRLQGLIKVSSGCGAAIFRPRYMLDLKDRGRAAASYHSITSLRLTYTSDVCE